MLWLGRLAATTAFLLLGLFVLGPIRPAYACTCLQQSDAQLYANATDVFKGEAIAREGDDPIYWTFDVDAVQKGDPEPFQPVAVDREDVEDCGWGFEIGHRYQVFAYEDDGDMRTGMCSGTREISGERKAYQPTGNEEEVPPAITPRATSPPPAEEEPIDDLDDQTPPVPGPSKIPIAVEEEEGSGFLWVIVLVAAAVAILIGLGLAAAGRGPTRR